jgi:hypothetical protein
LISKPAAASGALALALLAAPAAAGAWSAPFRLTAPVAADLGSAQVAVSPTGEIAVAFTVYEEDNPGDAQAFLALRSPQGRATRARSIPGAQQVLGLAFSGRSLELLTGSASPGQPCCTGAEVLSYADDAFGPAHTLSDQLTGDTVGRLTALAGGQLLAAYATDRAVWEAQWRAGARPGSARLISFRSSLPRTLAGAQTSGGETALAWIGASDRSGEQGAQRIALALGSAVRSPRNARVIFTAGTGHELDQLALAPAGAGISAAWTDSWFDRSGAYRSQAVVADLGATLRPRPLPVAGQSASGLSFAGGAAGEQVLAFKSCDTAGACWVTAAFRDAGGRFGPPARLGPTDPGQEPDAAVGSDGAATVGWIDRGHVFAVTRAPHASRPGAVQEVSSTNYASDLQIVTGASLEAAAVWTQGTLNPSLVGALSAPPGRR